VLRQAGPGIAAEDLMAERAATESTEIIARPARRSRRMFDTIFAAELEHAEDWLTFPRKIS